MDSCVLRMPEKRNIFNYSDYEYYNNENIFIISHLI